MEQIKVMGVIYMYNINYTEMCTLVCTLNKYKLCNCYNHVVLYKLFVLYTLYRNQSVVWCAH